MKISVIIPVFNNEPFLQECIESVLSQQGAEIELILIDDGSSDGSSKICDRYAKRAVVIHTPNRGVSAARNMGISIARGEYTMFVDSDDRLDPEHVREMLKKQGNDIIISGLKYFDTSFREPYAYETIPAKEGIYTGKSILENMIYPLVGGDMNHPFRRAYTGNVGFCMYRTELIREIRFPDIRRAEDLIFQLYALHFAKRVAKLEKYTYCYRVRQGADTRSHGFCADLWGCQLEILNCMDKLAQEKNLQEIQSRIYARTLREALHCAGNVCVPENTKDRKTKVSSIYNILNHKRVKEALRVSHGYRYGARDKIVLTAMEKNMANIIYCYLSIKKRGK